MNATSFSGSRTTGTPCTRRVIRAHEIVNEASRELRLDGRDGGEAVAFLAMAVAVHLKCALGAPAGRAAMQKAVNYAFGPEGT